MSSMEYMRPAEIKQDVRQMSERKRVNEILKSRQFREDLEKVVVDKINITPQVSFANSFFNIFKVNFICLSEKFLLQNIFKLSPKIFVKF